MTRVRPLVSIPVGVVIERRKANSLWAKYVWRPVAALPGVPEAAPWTVLGGNTECTNFYAGAAEVELYRSDTAGYRANLTTGSALLWVALRPARAEPPFEIVALTAEPGEGEALSENPIDIVEAVPMPEPVRAAIAEFIAEHHVERPFVKRKRDQADPEAMAHQTPSKGRK